MTGFVVRRLFQAVILIKCVLVFIFLLLHLTGDPVMVMAPDDVPRVVAEFLELDLADDVMRRVIEYCSRDYMVRNVSQFDDHVLREICDPLWGLPPGGSSAKVNASSRKLVLSDFVRQRLEQNWREGVTARTGFADYRAFRSSLPNHLGVDRSV